MKFNSIHYELSYYQAQTEAIRTVLVNELIYSNLESKLAKLKELHNLETNIEIKFDIGQAINSLESKPVVGYTVEQIKDQKLKKALLSNNDQIRHKALNFILKHKKTDLLPALQQIKKATNDIQVDIVILKLLSLNRIINFNTIYSYLRSKDERILGEVIETLADIKIQKSMAVIIQFLLHAKKSIRDKSLKALSSLDAEISILFVTNMIAHEKPVQRLAAVTAIGVLAFENASELLSRLLADQDEKVKSKAFEVVKKLKLSTVKPEQNNDDVPSEESTTAAQKLQNVNTKDSRKVASLLSSIGCVGTRDESLIKAIEPYLSHNDDRVRANALETLGRVYRGSDKSQFLSFLKDSNNRVIGNAISILCEDNTCPDEFYDQVNDALLDLTNNHGSNGCLTVIYCISNCLDERFLPHLSELYLSGDNQAAISAYGLLQSWADTSDLARDELSLIKSTSWDDDNEDLTTDNASYQNEFSTHDYEHLGFSDSKRAVWNSIPHYVELIKTNQKSLGILFLCFFSFELIGLLFSLIPPLSLFSSLSSFASALIWVFAPLVFVAQLFYLRNGEHQSPLLLIKSLGKKTFSGYIWTLLYLKLASLSGAIAICAISFLCWITLSGFLLINAAGNGSVFNMISVGAFFLMPYLLLVAMYYFFGFSLYHYFFQPNTGFHPIRASMLYVKTRWAVVFWAWLISNIVYVILNVCFWFIGYLEGMISAGIAMASGPGGILNSLSKLADILISGKIDMTSIPLLMNLAKGFLSTNFASVICSAIKSFISITFWSHQFLYFMGFYHHDNWVYPELYRKK